MSQSIGIIGGADGPTTVFITSAPGFGWINAFCLIIVLLMLIPNIIWAIKHHHNENLCKSRLINIIEQIGRYGSMLTMCVSVNGKLGFGSVEDFLIFLFSNFILLAAYFIFWGVFYKKQRYGFAMALAVIPCCIFLLCGITLRNWPLLGFGLLFAFGHITVTHQNAAGRYRRY